MTSGFGVDKGADGSGTTSSDIRKIQGGLYTPGIISGCVVTTSPSSMQYTISAGVVAIRVATGEIILAPVPQTTIPTSTSSSRTDIVYVKQRYPSIAGEGDANIVVGVATALPDRSLELRRFILSAGQTSTSQAVVTGGINYSIPYGASLGVLHEWQNTYDGPISIPVLREGHGSFTLPTDRRVKFSMTIVLSALNANGFDNSKYCEWLFLPTIDGGDFILWCTDGLHQAWATYHFEHYLNLSAGTHTTSIGAGRMVGPGSALQHYGLDPGGYGRRGQYYLVEDAGPIV